MATKDLYEELCKYYEFVLGRLPWREEFKAHMVDAFPLDELRVFFLLPFTGKTTWEQVRRRAGLPDSQLSEMLRHMAGQGFILAYKGSGGATYERGNLAFMTEQQVRTLPDCPRRTFFAKMMDSFIEGQIGDIPTRTPYYRVVPVESTVTEHGDVRRIEINAPVPDPRGVLPLDVVSTLIRDETHRIGVAECYCRRARSILGKGCDHPTETCFVFDDLADSLISAGIAREIAYDEAMDILRQCEESGLVHNVDNCETEIHSLCNCCDCCCVVLNTMAQGYTNTGRPSRYVVVYDEDRCEQCTACLRRCPAHCRTPVDGRLAVDTDACLGCGLCAAACPQGANRMVLREGRVSIPHTNSALYGQIAREAAIGLVKRKLFRR